ncbi:aminotransferase class V-fold PLP-dependent enzyme [Pseudanabaena sp. FACHB-1277]|uniref:Aminotransferase class V-fold PLP-dependent enzyme n=1 Tax=Pseudanabaena cinerea FACHB-1277 TaxID=2949581 RepID=A0A926URG7_9CYAN|nr:aminotransferase class V-fold PLP-dependent enzyme [Pseudanabaena cinerea]MBD2149717.1 aminotransferase class V-fold PLP-dependent enzyme [Pseudanabaena cinerea FACHB-1277]
MDQQTAPLLEIAQRYLDIDDAPFYMPGHKRGQGIDRDFADLLGKTIFRLDLPELPDLEEPIAQAQALAAHAYGSDRTWFLTNGSTCGVQAMIMATCGDGDKILIGRNCHKAAIAGLILSGADPIYLPTDYLPEFDLDLGVSPATLEFFLQKHPDVKAVMLVSPNYFGVCGDISQMAAIAHRYHLPLLIDAAHGAHLGFHPDLPISALQAGADLVVHSTHKMAGSLTQSSMLHLQSDRLDPLRIEQALTLLQSTSPNFLLLLSLDVARRQIVLQGQELLTQTLQLANSARSQIDQIPHLHTFHHQQIPSLDPTRLTVMIEQLGSTGFEIDEYLCHQWSVIAEMPTLTQLVFALSLGNSQQNLDRLVQGLETASKEKGKRKKEKGLEINYQLPITNHQLPITNPRRAYFALKKSVPITQAIGRISGETLCPYPPGVPLIFIGEEITVAVVELLQLIGRSGGIVNGASDPSLETILVVA